MKTNKKDLYLGIALITIGILIIIIIGIVI